MILGMTSVTTSINDYNYNGQSLLSKSSSCDSRDENSDVTVSLLDQCQDQHNNYTRVMVLGRLTSTLAPDNPDVPSTKA